jgi:uncharacterized protein YfiM (DUF2279 family)
MKAKRVLVLTLAIFGLLGVAIFDRAPAIQPDRPDAQAANAARALFDRLRDTGTDFQFVAASAAEVSAAAALAAQAAGVERSRTAIEDGAVVSRISVPVSFGLWINAEGRITPNKAGHAIPSGTAGVLPVPPWMARGLVWAVRQWFSKPGQKLPGLDAIVRNLKIGRSEVSADVRIPLNSAALTTLARANTAPIDGALTARFYCRLVAAQREQGIGDLGGLVRSAFARQQQTVEANKARLVAIAMVTVSPKVARLAGAGVEAAQRCGGTDATVALHSRTDLAKHWALSAALAAAFGRDASDVAGVWKELSDSADGGSGFSYVDLAADRAGILIGDRASRGETAAATAAWLAKASKGDLLPVSQLALAEGMSEAAFNRRYGAIDGTRHRAAVGRIDAIILKNLPR